MESLLEFFRQLFDPSGFVPRGGCPGWTPGLLWVYNVSDVLIFLAYMAIPATLIHFVRRRRDLPFTFVFWMFGAFIILCGLDHGMEAVMTVTPVWRFLGLVKVMTAIVSVATVFTLAPLVPRALALRSPTELEAVNRRLEAEVTERRRAEAELARRAEELAEANWKLRESERLKDEFVANVSHELRTPLTLVLGPLESLLAAPEDDGRTEIRPLLEGMHHNAVRLMQMVTGLLDTARLGAGGLEVRREPTDLAALIRSIAADFEPLMSRKRIQADVGIDVPPAPLEMDRYLYERILFNLLSNAAKFTPEGGRVSLRAGWQEGRLRLSVSDTGIGIREADLGSLFQRFRQVEGSSTRRFEGTGLGLALVKEFAELLDGSVAVESTPGHGSTFTVSCAAPLARDAGAPIQRTPQPVPAPMDARPAGQGTPEPAIAADQAGLPKVAIAEDNAEMAGYIAGVLRGSAQTRIAADGEEALDLVREWSPDVLLADVMMPGRDGFDLCRTLKSQPDTADIPVVLITALTHREALLKGWEAGADEYLYKPFHPRELLTRTRSLLAAVRQRREAKKCAELERSNRELEQFAYLASHDLQEPLRTVICFTGLLAESYQGKADPAAEDFMHRIIAAATRMRDLIRDLLEYSRLGQEAPPEAVSLEDALGEALSGLEGAIVESGAQVTHDPLPTVRGVRREFTQLLANLVGNAIKFRAGDRPPRIHIGVRKDSDSWSFIVRDNGIGIDPKHQDQLFQVFKRLHDRSRYSGTGIGLASCKKIVENGGGRIWVESEPGVGSTFHFTLQD